MVHSTIGTGIGGVKSNARLVIGRRHILLPLPIFPLAESGKMVRFFSYVLKFPHVWQGGQSRDDPHNVAISVPAWAQLFKIPRAGTGHLHTSQLPSP